MFTQNLGICQPDSYTGPHVPSLDFPMEHFSRVSRFWTLAKKQSETLNKPTLTRQRTPIGNPDKDMP